MIEKGSVYTEEGNAITISEEDEYWKYEYDLLNRMTAVYKWDEDAEEVALVKSYRYNGSNYRVVSTDAESVSTYYTFDTSGQMVEKSDSDATRDYIYLGTRVIAHVEDGETYYYGTDHIGSTCIMTDESGAVVWSGEVTPFADQESTEGLSEHVLYTGKELDEATGLYYYNARWYDPNLGRFTTEDPIRSGLNWYAYANNNPLKFVDPTGLMGKGAALAAAEENRDIPDADSSTGSTLGSSTGSTTEIPETDTNNSGSVSMIVPAEGTVTHDFGKSTHPITGAEYIHKGIDIAGEHGSPVVAAASGKVVDVDSQPDTTHGYGNYVIIAHEKSGWSGITTRSAHLDSVDVKVGDEVIQGQKIGTMGNTGAVAPKPTESNPYGGTHLHFEVRDNNVPKNPNDYFIEE